MKYFGELGGRAKVLKVHMRGSKNHLNYSTSHMHVNTTAQPHNLGGGKHINLPPDINVDNSLNKTFFLVNAVIKVALIATCDIMIIRWDRDNSPMSGIEILTKIYKPPGYLCRLVYVYSIFQKNSLAEKPGI